MKEILTLLEQAGSCIVPFKWENEHFYLLDQRILPHEEKWLLCRDWKHTASCITDMVVRGAPAIGITAAFGMVLAVKECVEAKVKDHNVFLKDVAKEMQKARPTAVNLVWALRRMIKALEGLDLNEMYDRAVEEALAIWKQDVEANIQMGRFGGELMEAKGILTHCNAGALATGGYGTALGVIRGAVSLGKEVEVFADETRPWLQGARLTAWELMKDNIDVTLNIDSAAGVLLSSGRIGAVVVGADRIAANGDVANKIGTYMLAVLCKENKVPFYVAAPSSTFDHDCATGRLIPVEERGEEEVTYCGNVRVAAKGVKVFNPVFDVTPSSLISAIITEKGVLRPPYDKAISDLPH